MPRRSSALCQSAPCHDPTDERSGADRRLVGSSQIRRNWVIGALLEMCSRVPAIVLSASGRAALFAWHLESCYSSRYSHWISRKTQASVRSVDFCQEYTFVDRSYCRHSQ